MKNCNIDSRGHIISYENDHGDTLTDYKQLSESLGLNKQSNSSSHSSSVSSGGSEPGNPPGLLAVASSIITMRGFD